MVEARRRAAPAPTRSFASRNDVLALRASIDNLTWSDSRKARAKVFVALGFFALLRVSEIVGLAVSDLCRTKDGWTIRIQRSKRDQESRGATVPIKSESWFDQAMERLIEGSRGGLLFTDNQGKRWSPGAARSELNRLAVGSGIQVSARFTRSSMNNSTIFGSGRSPNLEIILIRFVISYVWLRRAALSLD